MFLLGEIPLYVYSPNQNKPAGITTHARRVSTSLASFCGECGQDDEGENVANEGGVDFRVAYERGTPTVCSPNQNEPAGICRILPRESGHGRGQCG